MGELFGRYWHDGLSFAYNLVGEHALAEDLTSRAFTKTFAAMRSGKGPSDLFLPYLYRTIRSCVADHWHKTKHEHLTDEFPEAGRVEAGYARVEDAHERRLAARAIASLPQRWQQVIWYTEIEELPPRQIAPILGIGANAVSALLKRAKVGLRLAYLHEYAADGHHEDCAHFRPIMARSIAGTATSRENQTLQEHLPVCSHCPPVLERLQKLATIMLGTSNPLGR